jgi:shikimate dehydrogenase
MIDGRTRLLGLIGRGITHTLSPQIQNYALEQISENLVYLPFELDEQDVGPFLSLFPRFGGVGLNVTTPHKRAVGRLTRPGEDEVAFTEVVNTVAYRDGRPYGYATDGRGFVSWMNSVSIRPNASGVALIGFGSSSRSIAFQLGQHHPLTVVTRKPPEAEAVLQGWFDRGWKGLPVRVLSWGDPAPPQALLAVGGLPVSFARSKDVATWLKGLDPAGIVVDLNYGPGRTPLRDQARDRGLTAFDGLGLLIHQAALSLSLWLGSEVAPSLLSDGLEEDEEETAGEG